MEPSHRLAFLTYRTSGLVFPFGAPKDHFKHGNQYLFSPEGEWFGDDLSNPLDSWEYVFSCGHNIYLIYQSSAALRRSFKRVKPMAHSVPTFMDAFTFTFQNSYARLRSVSIASVSIFAFSLPNLGCWLKRSVKTRSRHMASLQALHLIGSTSLTSQKGPRATKSEISSRIGVQCSKTTSMLHFWQLLQDGIGQIRVHLNQTKKESRSSSLC